MDHDLRSNMPRPTQRLHLKSSLAATGVLVAVLVLVLGLLFHRSLNPDMVVFSNDVPLGAASAESNRMPEPLFGVWKPLNWVGYSSWMASPRLTSLTTWLIGPTAFAKFYAPFSLLFLGLGAAFFLRSAGLSRVAAILGALAAALNSNFFSVACWGILNWCICIGWCFLAIGILANQNARHRWLRVLLAGAAVGAGVSEGYDVGAIFSLAVASFILYQALFTKGPAPPRRLAKGLGTIAVVAIVSGLVAFQTVSSLVGTQIKGVSGMKAEERSSQERWDWATQWSLPKKEVLSLAVPGLFGYRMDTPDGGNYWGQVGRQPGWEEHHQGFARFSGGGIYAGILVLIVAVWAFAQSCRREHSVFSEEDRKWIWFWGGMCLISILLALGRYAPFYKFVYALPFFSTIRNPAKFTFLTSWALVVLFAYGVNGLLAHYASQARQVVAEGSWWKRLSGFDRKWVGVSGAVFFATGIVWLIYASSRQDLEAYLKQEAIDPGLAPLVAGFSISQVGVFVLLFGTALALVTLLLTGFFRGGRSAWAGVILGLLLVFDLGRANQPWIIYVNYKQKLATNPVIDLLRDKPYEHRVAVLPFPMPNQLALLDQLYRIEWHQHHFPYYGIQSLDIVQMPRMPEEVAAFEAAFRPDSSKPETVSRVIRRWELTNTRYLLGPTSFVEALNTQLDGSRGRFRAVLTFDIVPKPGVVNATKLEELTAVPSPNGRYAVIEFSGALPRARLYANWQVETNDAAALQLLASPQFDPSATVLVATELESPSAQVPTNSPAGDVEFVSYAPKHVVLQASNSVAAILLLNDKYDPNWKLTVDGQPHELLRCNSVMRGVFLQPGEHNIAFSFEPPVETLYVTLAAVGVSLLLLGVLVAANVWERRSKSLSDTGRRESAAKPDPDSDSRRTK